MLVMDGLREKRHFEKSAGFPRAAIIILTVVLSADIQQEPCPGERGMTGS